VDVNNALRFTLVAAALCVLGAIIGQVVRGNETAALVLAIVAWLLVRTLQLQPAGKRLANPLHYDQRLA